MSIADLRREIPDRASGYMNSISDMILHFRIHQNSLNPCPSGMTLTGGRESSSDQFYRSSETSDATAIYPETDRMSSLTRNTKVGSSYVIAR